MPRPFGSYRQLEVRLYPRTYLDRLQLVAPGYQPPPHQLGHSCLGFLLAEPLLQLLQAGIIDVETFRGMLHNLGQLDIIRDGVRKDRSEAALFGMLEQQAAQGDPRAALVLAQTFKDPDNAGEIVTKFFTPEQPEVSPEEQQFLQGGQQQGPPPDVMTALSQLSQGGSIQGGGVQTVGRMPG